MSGIALASKHSSRISSSSLSLHRDASSSSRAAAVSLLLDVRGAAAE